MLNMSDTIKTRRRELGLTQEGLAALLGVSGPAVSKWEQGASFPDVTLLPALARALHTDLNTLMGFVHAPDKRQITAMLTQVSETAKADGIQAGIDLAREMLREYPDCGPLLFGLAVTIDGSMMMAGLTQAEREPYSAQGGEWYARAADSEDEESRLAASHLLASYALSRGDVDKAQEMMNRLPVEREGPAASRWPLDFRLMLARGEKCEAETFLQNRLYTRAADMQQMLLSLEQLAVEEGNLERAGELAALVQGFVTLMGLPPYTGHAARLMAALAQKDAQESLMHLRAMLASFTEGWSPERYPLYDRSSVKKSEHAGSGMFAGILRELEDGEAYAFLRKEDEFKALLAAYKEA